MQYERIRNLREDSDLTQAQVGELLHISQRTYSHYELGTHKVPVDILADLAALYNTSVDYIIGRTDIR